MLPDLAPALSLSEARFDVDALADEDPAFADALRAMLWDVYCSAGLPLGPDEDAMWAWWAFGQGTTVQ